MLDPAREACELGGSCAVRGLQLADVSVVIPAYNAARLIVDTIRSVKAQSMADIEIIVVNDGSTDATLEVVRGFADRDPRIRIVSQENGGLAAARNAGLREARGSCVAFLDSDDIWHPDFLSEMYQALAGAPDAPFAYAYSFRFDVDNSLIPGMPWPYVPRHDFRGLLALNSIGNGSAAMFRRDLLLRIGGYDASLRARGAQGAEDWKMCLQLAAISTPVLVPKRLVGYRLVEGGMSQGNPETQLRAVRTVMADIRKQFPQTPARYFAHGRTVLNGWLLPSFKRHRRHVTVLRLLFEAYALNPLWFTCRELRTLHAMKIRAIWRAGEPRVALVDWVVDGKKPFTFLVPGGC